MTNDCTLTRTSVPTSRTAVTPQPESVFISVAEVLLASAAIPSTSIRWIDALRRKFLEPVRAARRTHPPRRSDFFESAAMAREMCRL